MAKIFVQLTLLLMLFSLPVYGASDGGEQTSDETQSEQAGAGSTPAGNESVPIDPPKPSEYFLQSDISHYFNPDQVKSLLAGDSEFYALFQDDMTGRPRGVALLIPDWSQSALSARGIDFLRTQLPDYGWVTLSMVVPDTHLPVFNTGPAQSLTNPEPREAAPANAPAMRIEPSRFVDEQYMQQYELMFKMRMQSLLSEAENYQGYFIVIAQGSSAAVLASLYAKSELPEPEAMILLSASMPDAKLTQKMNIDIANNPIPTLDIYQSRGVRWSKENAKMRKKLAKKYFKPIYRNKELYGDISYHNQNHRLLRSVYNWLSGLGL